MTNFVKILAMSKTLKEMKFDLSHQGPFEFAQHSAKLMVCRYNDRNIQLWEKQLYNFCAWIMQDKIKPSNKYPSRDLIWEYFFCNNSDFVDTYAVALRDAWNVLELNYKGERNTSNDQQLFDEYRKFCNEVCDNLAKHTLTTEVMINLANKHIVNLYWKLLGE